MESQTFYLTLIVAILTIVIIPLIVLTVKSMISHSLLKRDVEELQDENENKNKVYDDIHDIKSDIKVILSHMHLGENK